MNAIQTILPKLLDNKPLNSSEQKNLNILIKNLLKKPDVELSSEEAFILGYLNEQEQRYQKAVVYFDYAIQSNPSFEAAYYHKGLCLLELSDFSEALVNFDEAIKIDDSFIQAKIGKARILRSQNHANEAVALLESLDVDDSISLDYYTELSASYDHNKQTDKAIEANLKALEENPKDANLIAQRALLLLFNQSYEEALNDFLESQRIAGVNYVTQFNLGLCYAMMDGYTKNAHQQFQRSFNKYPGLLNNYFKTATQYEVEKLSNHIKAILQKLEQTDATVQGKFYRDELHELLSRKLNEALPS